MVIPLGSILDELDHLLIVKESDASWGGVAKGGWNRVLTEVLD